VSAVAEARRNSLIGVLATVGILMLFSAELLTIFVATLVIQMIFFGYSQILEFGTEKIFDENKRKMKSLLKSLPQLKGHDE
jgi:ABC-type bacteriocin/lantibiotic exporter with double-glycine peptidase domain